MDQEQLIEEIRVLALAREELAKAKDKAKAQREAFDQSLERQAMLAQQTILEASVTNIEAELRNEMARHYQATGFKSLADGALGIRVSKAFHYTPDEATAWAKSNAPVLLVLDQKAFEKMIGSLEHKPAFVIETPDVKATIATDLSKYLKPEGGEAGTNTQATSD